MGKLRMLPLLLVLLLWRLGVGVAWGQTPAPPELTRLFPAGAPRGQSTMIQVQGKFDAESVKVWTSAAGLSWSKREGDGQFQVEIPSDVEPGPIWLRLVDQGGASEVLPFVIGHHPEITETEPNDRSDQAPKVPELPIVINGVLQSGGDVDHFGLSLRSGQQLVAFLDAERFLKSAVDATLQLVTTEGQILAQNLDHRGLDPQLVWVADRDIDVVLRVFGFPAAPDSTISLGGGEKFIYRLGVTTGTLVEAVEPLAFDRQQSLRYARHGWNQTADTLFEVPSSAERESVRLFWPDALGQFELPVLPHPSKLARDLRLPESRLATADESAMAIELPITITGRLLEPRQTDDFLVRVPADKQWRIQVEAHKLGYAWDPCLEVWDPSVGTRLHRQDDQGSGMDPDWVWAPGAGVYQLRVFDLHGHDVPHQWYRLTITEQRPEVKLTVGKTSFRGQIGEVLDIPVTLDRRHGHTAEVEFGLVSLDAAVENSLTLEPVRSVAGDDSAKQVVLKVSGSEIFSGPVRLLAWEKDTPERKHAILESSTGLDQLWLTFGAAVAGE